MKAQGTKLKRQNVYAEDGTGAYTMVPKCRNFTYGQNADVTDLTTLDDEDWTDNDTSMKSQQPVNFELLLDPSHAMHDETTGIIKNFKDDDLLFWELQPRAGKARRFLGKVTTCEEAYQTREHVVMKVTITPRKAPAYVDPS